MGKGQSSATARVSDIGDTTTQGIEVERKTSIDNDFLLGHFTDIDSYSVDGNYVMWIMTNGWYQKDNNSLLTESLHVVIRALTSVLLCEGTAADSSPCMTPLREEDGRKLVIALAQVDCSLVEG